MNGRRTFDSRQSKNLQFKLELKMPRRRLSALQLEGFKKYKVLITSVFFDCIVPREVCPANNAFLQQYSSRDTSPLAVYVMHPFWNQAVKVSLFTSKSACEFPLAVFDWVSQLGKSLFGGVGKDLYLDVCINWTLHTKTRPFAKNFNGNISVLVLQLMIWSQLVWIWSLTVWPCVSRQLVVFIIWYWGHILLHDRVCCLKHVCTLPLFVVIFQKKGMIPENVSIPTFISSFQGSNLGWIAEHL